MSGFKWGSGGAAGATNVCATIVAIVALCAPVAAQDEPQNTEAESTDKSDAPEKVVVTAQRRSQRLQDVPISVTAIGKHRLERSGVNDIEDTIGLVPGVDFQGFGTTNQSNVFVRGIGTSLADGGVETSVGFYVDDVYIGAQQAFNAALFDLSRVELLRGPQGTLYGKNTLGGAIKFFGARPEPEQSLTLESNFGNLDYFETRVTANQPIVEDKILSRISGVYKTRDGIIENLYPGTEDYGTTDSVGVRGALAIEATENLSIDVIVDASHDEPTIQRGPLATVVETRQVTEPLAAIEERDIWGASTSVAYDDGDVVLSSITAYRDLLIDTVLEGDLPNAPFLSEQDIDFNQFSQELRLSSPSGQTVEWLLGAYFYEDESSYRVPFTLGTLAGVLGYPPSYTETSLANLDTTTWAVFADATWHVTEQLGLTVGARYTDERKGIDYTHTSNYSDPDFQAIIDAVFGPGSGLTPDLFRLAPLQSFQDTSDHTDVSPRVVASYRWNDDIMTYVSAARGFKSGGFNSLFVGATSQFAFDSESAWSYEAGIKSSWLDNRLILNAAAYHVDWRDQQVRSFIPGPGGTFQLLITNAAGSVSQGVDVEVVTRLLPELDVSLAYSYVDATFDEFTTSPFGDLSGNRLPLVPEHSFSVALDYTRHVGGGIAAFVHVDYGYRSDRFSDDQNSSDFVIEARELVNGRVGFEHDDWELSIWANNLFDEEYKVFATPQLLGPEAVIGEPQTFGTRLVLRL